MATVKYSYGQQFDLEITVNERHHLDIYPSKIRIKRKYNTATSVTLEFNSVEVLDILHIGSQLDFYGSRKFGGGTGGIGPFQIKTSVKIMRPTETGCVVVCADRISDMATSELVDYKPNDYVGDDLMCIAKSVFDTMAYDYSPAATQTGDQNFINTTYIESVGCGIPVSKEMNIWGLQTKKQFIDNLFSFMYKKIIGTGDTEYPNNFTWLPYRYQITHQNYIQFYYTDNFHKYPRSILTLNDQDSDMITGGGIIGQIDMSQSFNSITAVSKKDSSVYALYEDVNSIAKHDRNSKKITIDSISKDYMEFIAMQIVERSKEPSYSYNFSVRHNEFFSVGDPITVQAPSLGVDVTLPITEIEIMIGNGSVETKINLGEKMLPIEQLVGLISAHTPNI